MCQCVQKELPGAGKVGEYGFKPVSTGEFNFSTTFSTCQSGFQQAFFIGMHAVLPAEQVPPGF
ncbi:hypothetical protein DPQ25_07990 [Hydrogeniiclostridium mannosilyticum]|uniref:Uncharacterized protein n=1 Tax=Hydrogeniiclostridium mannosilyticum TaxID=2764322 RepID=A0A328UHN6_9FIRM|nr:hypothetical protein DPQ25_07990 [Hydrogeniiclostridium mannosilyticum]